MDAWTRCRCSLCVIGVTALVATLAEAQAATPPVVIDGASPELPADRAAAVRAVVVVVVVETDGSVSDARPAVPEDDVLDAIAVEAVRGWRFAPARRGDLAIRARARVEVRFRETTVVAGESEGESESESEGASEGEDESEDEGEVLPVYSATGTVDPIHEAAAPRSASDAMIDLAHSGVPRRDAGDALSSAPGVYVTRGEGDAVANAIAVRGFDADHGQDVELTLSGVPLNAPSHVHGQGYVDLGFLLPEVVSSARVTEGVHDPRQGDFAIAGSIDLALGVAQRGLTLRSTYGSFDTIRESLVWAPAGERDGTFVAGAYRTTHGFGAQRAGQQGTVLAQDEIALGRARVRLLGLVHSARYGLAGVLRYDDVAAGIVAFDGAYADHAAARQEAVSTRASVAATVDLALDRGSFAEIQLWGGYTDFLLRANYTGYALVSGDPSPAVRARGDRFQQTDTAFSAGLGARWRSERITVVDDVHGFVEIGARGRFDVRDQAHGLATSDADVVWRPAIAAGIRVLDAGAWIDLDVHVADVVRLRGGVRAELFAYDVADRLSTARVSPTAGVVSPRASIEVNVARGVVLAASYGEGFRSAQAQPLLHLDAVPIARVQTGDLGARFSVGTHDELALQLAGFVSALSSDLVFEADEGSLESVGPSTRVGAAMHLVTHPWPWLRGLLSATYVHATLDAPPTATPGAPAAYVAGEALPYVPPVVVRAEASADEVIAILGDRPIRLRGALGFTFLSPRPLPYQDVARAVGLLDASVGFSWGGLDVGVDVLNVLDQRYAALEYAMQATWSPSATPITDPSRAFAAGAPLTILATVGARVD